MLQPLCCTINGLCGRDKCGSYQFGPTDTSRTNICLNENTASALPTKQYKVNNVVVQMGNDGTNDAVSLEVRRLARISRAVTVLCRSVTRAAHRNAVRRAS